MSEDKNAQRDRDQAEIERVIAEQEALLKRAASLQAEANEAFESVGTTQDEMRQLTARHGGSVIGRLIRKENGEEAEDRPAKKKKPKKMKMRL